MSQWGIVGPRRNDLVDVFQRNYRSSERNCPYSPILVQTRWQLPVTCDGITHVGRLGTYCFVWICSDGIFTGKRFLYVNLMINAGGMWFNFMSSYQHAQIYTMSDSSDANLLVSIDQFKVRAKIPISRKAERHSNLVMKWSSRLSQPDILSAFPTQLAYICQHPALDDYDLSTIRTVISGGSTINPVFERQIFDRLPNLRAFVIVMKLFTFIIWSRCWWTYTCIRLHG